MNINKILIKFVNKNNLLSKVVKGSFWLGMGSGIEQIFRLIRNMILARLLLPEAFGIMAILLAVNTFFESFTEIGIKEVIIQNKYGLEESFLNTAFFFTFIRGIILFVFGFILAPYISSFYQLPTLTVYLRIIFITLLFRGGMSVKIYSALKKMDFKKWIYIEHLGGVIGVMTSIILTLFYRNIIVLISGYIIEALSRFILSYILCPFVPSLRFNKKYFWIIAKFSKGIFGIPILTFVFLRTDIFVIGKLCTTDELGMYSLALSIARFPGLIMGKFVPLLMPTFSAIKEEIEKIRYVITKFIRYYNMLTIPSVFFIFLYGGTILSIIFTPAYKQVALPFAVLFLTTILRSSNTPIATIYLSTGHPSLLRIFTLVRAIILLIIIYPMTIRFNLIGSAFSLLISMVVSYILQIVLLKKLIYLSIKDYWMQYLYSILLSSPVLLVYLVIKRISIQNESLFFILGVLSLLATYVIVFLYIKTNGIINGQGEKFD